MKKYTYTVVLLIVINLIFVVLIGKGTNNGIIQQRITESNYKFMEEILHDDCIVLTKNQSLYYITYLGDNNSDSYILGERVKLTND